METEGSQTNGSIGPAGTNRSERAERVSCLQMVRMIHHDVQVRRGPCRRRKALQSTRRHRFRLGVLRGL